MSTAEDRLRIVIQEPIEPRAVATVKQADLAEVLSVLDALRAAHDERGVAIAKLTEPIEIRIDGRPVAAFVLSRASWGCQACAIETQRRTIDALVRS